MNRSDFEKKVKEYIEKENLLNKGDRIVVGLSGGADSVCLINVLAALKKDFDLTIYAVHVNHCIRGEDADNDEAFSLKLAESLGMECRCIRISVKELAEELGLTEEEAGRKVRYDAFEKMCIEKNADKIAVAHHMNDQAETILFRMCRGTGIKGMRGMLPQRDNIIRPLLCVTRDEIEEYLKDISQEYCTDYTNEETEYNRNKIRKLILPELCEVNESAIEHICDMAGRIRDVYEWFEEECLALYEKLIETEPGGVRIKADELSGLKDPIRQEIVRMMIDSLTKSLKDIENRHITGICALSGMESGKRIILPYNLIACREYEFIRIYRESDGAFVGEDDELTVVGDKGSYTINNVFLPGEKRYLDSAVISYGQFIYNGKIENVPKNHCKKWFDYDKMKGDIILRRAKPDDYILIGKNSRKKLSRYMIDSKIPRQYRECLFVLACGAEVLWIVGERSNPAYYVTDTTKNILEVSLTL